MYNLQSSLVFIILIPIYLCDSFNLSLFAYPVPCGRSAYCAFPYQYCKRDPGDWDQETCEYCQDDFCGNEDIPQQCHMYCNGGGIIENEIKKRIKAADEGFMPTAGWVTLLIALGLMFVCLVIVIVVCYFSLRKRKKEKQEPISDPEETQLLSEASSTSSNNADDRTSHDSGITMVVNVQPSEAEGSLVQVTDCTEHDINVRRIQTNPSNHPVVQQAEIVTTTTEYRGPIDNQT